MTDYLIVGAGLSGCILAERLANSGKKVLIIDKRRKVGGNCHDYYNNTGVLVHKYGAHCIYTDNKKVIDYLSKFTKFRNYALKVKTLINGNFYTIPINRNTLNEYFRTNLKNEKETSILLNF